MTENNAIDLCEWIRWRGVPACVKCGHDNVYPIARGRIFRCAACKRDFSVTSATALAGRKMQLRAVLLAICLFSQADKGISALQLSRNLDVNYKVAFVLLHKFREAIAADVSRQKLHGTIEIDGATFGGYRKVENNAGKFVKRRYVKKYNNRHVVVVARQRLGRTVPVVVEREFEAIDAIKNVIEKGSIIVADGAHAWDSLEQLFDMLRIEHVYSFSANNACTNWAESYFSLLRRMHLGVHHKIDKRLMFFYACEMAWKQDFRDIDDGAKAFKIAELLMQGSAPSQWKGYWQRRSFHG